MKIYMIRHGATKGNRERRYVGSTDEGLLPEEKHKLVRMRRQGGDAEQSKMPEIQKVYVSPMRRCRETAELIYPGVPQEIVEDFKECRFGEFEYRNYKELNGNPHYQRFIDTMGECGFPGGETRSEFQKRCVYGMEKVLSSTMRLQKSKRFRENGVVPEDEGSIALVVHGGTIMALLDAYSNPHRDYYEWQIGTGKGFCANAKRDAFGVWNFMDIHEILPSGETAH